MKTIYEFDKEVGGDGAHAKGGLGVEAESLKAFVEVTYPLAKVIEPATKALDSALDKLEKLIPGDWDKGPIEKIKAEYKAELLKLLAE